MVWRRWFIACSTSMAVLLYRMRPANFIINNLISHRDIGFGFGCWKATIDLGNRWLLLLWGFDDSTKSSKHCFLLADSIASSIARRSSTTNPCSPCVVSWFPLMFSFLFFSFFPDFSYFLLIPIFFFFFKVQNGVVVLTAATNSHLTKFCIDKNWKLEDWIDKTES